MSLFRATYLGKVGPLHIFFIILMNPAIKYLCTGEVGKKFKVGIIFYSMKKFENVTFIGERGLFRATYLEK